MAYKKFLYQKIKITWLKLGDDCTGYFYAAMKGRKTQNRVLSFIDNGVKVDDFQRVMQHFLNHFKSFIGTECSPPSKLDRKYIAMGNSLTIE